jgi:peptide/nickel transport system substrate-binding protein
MHYYGSADLYNYESNSFGFKKGDLSGVRAKTTTPLGAGPYKFVSYENNVASYVANETYYLGAPKIKNFKIQGVGTADKITGMTTDLFDATVPNFNDDDIAAIKKYNPNGELVGSKLTTITTDFLGYGYIGINADNVKVGNDKASDASKALRRALATIMAVFREPVVYAYYGDRASIIQYPISNTSWAAPKPADEGYNLAYSKNAAGEVVITADMSQDDKVAAAKEAAKTLFIAAGYTFDEAAGVFTAAPEGAAMEWEIIIPADGIGDHPAYGILTETKNALNEMGLDLIINDPADSNELWDALDAGTAEMWAAAWGSTVDPDMYQVYHSSNIHGLEGSSNSNHYGIQSDVLDNLIEEGRSSTDQAFRKATYKEALEEIMAWGVELPTYQRQNATLFSTERVNVATIPGDLTPFYGWMAEIHTLEMN